MHTDKETRAPEQEKKSPFKDAGEAGQASAGAEQEETSKEEDSEAEQQRKEALTERD